MKGPWRPRRVRRGFARDCAGGHVLRRGPRHLRRISNDVMRREMRVLAALVESDVPHPTFFTGCTDETVMNGAVFYLMEPVNGFNASLGLPALHAGDARVWHAM